MCIRYKPQSHHINLYNNAKIIFLSNNIEVDPGDPCHTEQSEVSLFCVVMRSIDFSPYLI